MRFVWVLLALLLAPGALVAQPSNEPNEIELAQAKAKYETAARLYDLGQYDQALKGFRESYLISGAPALLLNIGQCYRALHKDDEAIKAFESYLRTDPEGEYQAQVQDMLSELKAQQEKMAVVAAPIEKPPIGQQAVFYYGVGGALGAGALILGGVSLGSVAQARSSFDEGLFAQSQQQFRKARVTAAIADALQIGGAVGVYVGYKKNKETRAKEAPVAALTVKRQQLMLQVYF